MKHSPTSCGVLAAFLVAAATAQDDGAGQTQQLRAALVKMASLDAVAFRSVVTQDQAFMRSAGMGGQDQEVEGIAGRDVLTATVNDGDDTVVFAGGRMIARETDADWKLRRDCLADGGPLPYVHDPRLTFAFLAELPEGALRVVHTEPGKLRDRDVVVYSVTASGEQAQDLSLGGILPKAAAGPGGFLMLGGGGAMRMPAPETTVDLAFWVDPATHEVLRLHTKTYTKSNLPGGMVVRVAGAGGVEIEQEGGEDEVDAKPAKDGELTFRKGLPVRKLTKDLSLTEFDVSYSKHGAADVPELSARAKTLLGIR